MSEPTGQPAVGYNAAMEEILDAATRVFAERGFDGSSVDDIADAMGATKGRIYHYWRGKDALLAAVMQRGLERGLAAIEPIAHDTTLAEFERLERLVWVHMAWVVKDPDIQKVLLHSVDVLARRRAPQREYAESINALRRRYEQQFIRLIEAGQRNGTVAGSDPRLTARGLLGTMNWTAVWHRPARDPQVRAAEDAHTIHELSSFAIRGLKVGNTSSPSH